MSQCFMPDEHIRLQRDFDRLFREGKPLHFSEFVARALPNGLERSRLGLSVGRRVGNAVRRNRIKRLLREAWRLNRDLLGTPCDVVFVPRPSWRELKYAAIEPTMQRAMRAIATAFAAG